jgi:hypothetical protein
VRLDERQHVTESQVVVGLNEPPSVDQRRVEALPPLPDVNAQPDRHLWIMPEGGATLALQRDVWLPC